MENNVRTVQSYQKTPLVEVLEASHYIRHFLPPASNSLLLSHLGELWKLTSTEPLLPLLGSRFNELCCPYGSSSQPRLIQAPQDEAQSSCRNLIRWSNCLRTLALTLLVLDRRMRRKLPSKKFRLLQTDIVGAPSSSVTLRPTTDIDAGKHPRKKVLTAANAGRNESPHSLIRWTSSTQTNRTLDQQVGLSIISLHSLLRRCSGSTHMTCQTFRTLLRVSWQLEKADLWSFESSFT